MIGRWMETQPAEVLDRFLECKMVPFVRFTDAGEGCLLGVALGEVGRYTAMKGRGRWLCIDNDEALRVFGGRVNRFANQFNLLCQRLVGVPRAKRLAQGGFFGTPDQRLGGARAARLLRDRVLRIYARRALADVRETATA